MFSRRITALLFLLFATMALAGHKKIRPGEPQTTCLIDERGEVRDAYTIRGRNWDVTEDQFKSAINSPGTVLTAWEWRSAVDEDSAPVFKAKFRLPICEENVTKKKLAKLVEPFPFKVKCYKPSDGGGPNDMPPGHDEVFLTGKWPKYRDGFGKPF